MTASAGARAMAGRTCDHDAAASRDGLERKSLHVVPLKHRNSAKQRDLSVYGFKELPIACGVLCACLSGLPGVRALVCLQTAFLCENSPKWSGRVTV